jgi:hypothetical protein
MPFEKFDFETLSEERRKSVAQTLRVVSVEEMKKMGDQMFKYADDPWRETYFKFIAEHPGATYHHGVTNDGVNVLYSQENDKGLWFIPGSGMGPLQEKGRKAMKQIIQKS